MRQCTSVSARLLASLPAELGRVLADASDVFLAAAFDRGDRQTAERQIREVLRVRVGVRARARARVRVRARVRLRLGLRLRFR
jgi:hypothetical protein